MDERPESDTAATAKKAVGSDHEANAGPHGRRRLAGGVPDGRPHCGGSGPGVWRSLGKIFCRGGAKLPPLSTDRDSSIATPREGLRAMRLENIGNVSVEIFNDEEALDLLPPRTLTNLFEAARKRHASTGKAVCTVGRWSRGDEQGVVCLSSHHRNPSETGLIAMCFYGPEAEVNRVVGEWLVKMMAQGDGKHFAARGEN